MAETSFPFDTNGIPTEAEWSTLFRNMIPDGVIRDRLDELEPFADSTGMQVKVRTGEAFVRGFHYDNDAVKTIAVAAAHASQARIDRVILRLDLAANEITAEVLTGTPAGSPVAPSLTQTSTTWEIPLATVAVAASATGIAAVDVTDARQWTSQYDEQATAFAVPDVLSVTTGKGFFEFPWPARVLGFSPYVNTAPTGASLILDANKNGTTIFTTQANRPTVAASANTVAEVTNMDVTDFAAGDRLSVDVDQVGSTVAGADLVVTVRFVRLS